MPCVTIGYIANDGQAKTASSPGPRNALRDELEDLVARRSRTRAARARRRASRPASSAARSSRRRDSGARRRARGARASTARGDGPSGFSFEASLIAPEMPSSRSSSSIGLPGCTARAPRSTASRAARGSRRRPLAPPWRAGTSRARAASARLAAGLGERAPRPARSSRWPSMSRKNRYSQGLPGIGRDWIEVRFTPWRAKGSSSRCSAPACALRTVKTARGQIATAAGAARRGRAAGSASCCRGGPRCPASIVASP